MTDRDGADLRVLQLTSSRRSFFDQQVDALETVGVDCETVAVPARDGRERGRGPREYLAFYLRTLGRGLEAFDLVHANYGLLGPPALAQPTRPVVLTLWGSDLMGVAWLTHVSRLSARFSDAVIVPTADLARRLDCPCEVVPFGVDTELFRPIPREEARDRIGWDTDPDERVVVFPYDPDRQVKDYPLAERVVDRVSDARLEVVSGVPHEEMPYVLNASDALLVTSRRESGPLVLKEAAACNVPVVSRNVGFAAEVLAGVRNAALADGERDLATRLEGILDDGGRSDGREAVRDLDRRELGERIVGVYRSAIAATDGR